MESVVQLFFEQSKSKRLAKSPMKGGDAMSVYEIIVVLFLSMNFVVGLVKLMMYISDKFPVKRK